MPIDLIVETANASLPRFHAAVSLHSHTLHSKESLGFVPRMSRGSLPLRLALKHGMTRYRAVRGTDLDFNRAWWTPPLAPHDAWSLESSRIEREYGARAMVSITDHDEIEAPLSLRVLEQTRDTPISVEWTVPFGGTFFHLGVHNLPENRARTIFDAMRAYTRNERLVELEDILRELNREPAALVVFNHPCWDELGIGDAAHVAAACAFARRFGGFLHAFEINGLRPWKENQRAIDFARACGSQLISGGDRHAAEPNAVLNLTNASTFAGFVAEVRAGHSQVLITKSYLECFVLRILRNIEQVLAEYEHHGRGWRRWSDRVFYQCDDGQVRSMSQLWPTNQPAAVKIFVGGVRMLRGRWFQETFRALAGGDGEIA